MQTRLLTLVLMAISLTAFPQGKVTFGNDSSRLFMIVQYGGPLPIPMSPLANGRTLTALLYAGTGSANLTLQTAIPLTGANLSSPGRMVSTPVILSGVPGGASASFEIFLADTGGVMPTTINNQTTFQDYWNSGGYYFGTSGLFTFTPGSSLSYPYLGGPSSTWQTGDVVAGIPLGPEPSTRAMVGLGLITLLVLRQRGAAGVAA